MSYPAKKKVLILGSGFAGCSLLKEISSRYYDVTLISPRNHFLFTPLLPSTTVGTVEFRSIIEPVRLIQDEAGFIRADCKLIDPINKKVHAKAVSNEKEFTLDYDYLVIAVGGKNQTFGLPGVEEHAYFLKEIRDARKIRQRIIDCFEMASSPGVSTKERDRLLHFVVVGGGPTGVEFAAEMHDFLTEDLENYFPDLAGQVRITLLEATNQILNSFDKKLSEYTKKIFKRQKISIRTQAMVQEIKSKKIILKGNEEVPYGLVVWSAGIGPTELIQQAPFQKNKASKIITHPDFSVLEYPEVFAIGDCAQIQGQDHPATAQVAQQSGVHLGKQFNRLATGKETKNFKYNHMGMLAYVGSKRALADLKNVKGKGFSTYLFWRSAYLTKLVSFKNKVLVLFDWAKTKVFGRDISRF